MTKPATLAHVTAEQWLREHSHGHVIARLDGRKKECGGTAKCYGCMVEQRFWMLVEAVRQSTCAHHLNRGMWVERKIQRRPAYVCRECGGFVGYIAAEVTR